MTRTQAHTTETDAPLPATPDEQLQSAIQMDKVREYTVRPGLLRVPVEELTTAANSPQYVLQLHHPVIDEADIRYFIPKPEDWDPQRFLWPRFLDWYGYTTRSQYELQTDRVYIERNRRTGEWELTKPPSDARRYWWRWQDAISHRVPSRLDHALGRGWRALTTPLQRVRRAAPGTRGVLVLLTALVTHTATLLFTLANGWATSGATAMGVAAGLFALLVTALVVEPPGGGA